MINYCSKKNTQPLVSVIAPIYNVEKYLRQCITSILNQTLKDLEIILINDGSTDSSLDIIREYASADPRIIVVDKPNSGYGHSMNIGLSKATGKYVGIVESDDWIEPDMFEVLYRLSEKDGLDVSRSEFFFYDTENGEHNRISETSYVPHDRVLAPCDENSVFMQQPSIWANLYLRSFLEENNIRFLETPGASYQDTSFSFKVYACASRFEMIGRAFYHYRIDGGSSSFQNTTKVYCVCDEYDEIWRFVREHGLYEKYRYLIPQMQYRGYKWNYQRLAQPYCDEFFVRWQEDFLKLRDAEDLDPNVFSDLDRKMIGAVLAGNIPTDDKPSVSIIVPVYNVRQYLPKCLDSLVNQTLKNIEIICVDDGSTDGSGDILAEYASKDGRIRVITKKNGGLSSARNAGIAVARADYLGFVDSDDWVEADTFESAFFAMNNVDLVCFGTNLVGDMTVCDHRSDLEYYRIKYAGLRELNDEMRLNIDASVWNKLFSAELVRKYGLEFPVGKLYEDFSFYWRYILLCRTAYFIPEPKYNYLRRTGSIMAETFKGNKRAIEHLQIFPEIYYFIRDRNLLGGRAVLLNALFLNCFWFSYLHVPDNLKKKVLRLGTKEVRELDLGGDPVIESLWRAEYNNVDARRTYTYRVRLYSRLIDKAESTFGGDLGSLRKMFYGTYRNSFDVSDSVATTEWVTRHETDLWIERWSVIFDPTSDQEFYNWGRRGGIKAYEVFEIPETRRCIFVKGTELKILVTIGDVETAVLHGTILDDHRSVWGNSFYDGESVFVISVDLCPDSKTIRARAKNTTSGEDVSENCKILRIESRIYG